MMIHSFIAMQRIEHLRLDAAVQLYSHTNTLIVVLFSTLKQLNVQTNYRRLYHVDYRD